MSMAETMCDRILCRSEGVRFAVRRQRGLELGMGCSLGPRECLPARVGVGGWPMMQVGVRGGEMCQPVGSQTLEGRHKVG